MCMPCQAVSVAAIQRLEIKVRAYLYLQQDVKVQSPDAAARHQSNARKIDSISLTYSSSLFNSALDGLKALIASTSPLAAMSCSLQQGDRSGRAYKDSYEKSHVMALSSSAACSVRTAIVETDMPPLEADACGVSSSSSSSNSSAVFSR